MADIGRLRTKIVERLSILQHERQEKFLLIKQYPIGLGGQISNRVDGLALAIATNRKAIFIYDDDPPYSLRII